MKTFKNFAPIISKISLAMLVLFSMAFFVAPTKDVQAQSNNAPGKTYLCLNQENGDLKKAFGDARSCPPTPYELFVVDTVDRGVCVNAGKNGSGANVVETFSPNDPEVSLNSTGTKCIIQLDDGGSYEVNFVAFTSISQYTPSGQTNTNNNGNSNNGNSNGNSNNGNSNNGNGNNSSGGPGGGGPSNTTRGDCEENFHKVGPLCVPNNPFNNNSIAGGEPTVASLAVRVIRILLYFAAIIAVIMAIIGGYRVMTAGGNEAQAATGRKTLTNAIIGLAITILAYIIVQAVINFITK